MPKTTPETARLTGDAVIFGELDGEFYVLLIERGSKPFAGHLAVPGGHLDRGEETEAAARRELAEETGLLVEDLRFVGVYAEPERDPRGRYVTFAYTAVVSGLPAAKAADDAKEARWIPVADALAPATALAFDHQLIIKDALRVAARRNITLD